MCNYGARTCTGDSTDQSTLSAADYSADKHSARGTTANIDRLAVTAV
jgi:hypothetical protein